MRSYKTKLSGCLLCIAAVAFADRAAAQCADWRARGAGLHVSGIVFDSVLWDADGAGPQAPMLVLGGSFSRAANSETVLRNIAAWDGTNWHALGTGLGEDSQSVRALAVYNGELIAGGNFTTAGGQPVSRIARWDGAAWHPLGNGMGGGSFPNVYALTVFNGDLIAGGEFTTAGGQPANLIARWNGTSWSALGEGIQANSGSGVQALAVYNGQLIAGGSFAFAGQELAFNIARWNGTWNSMDDIFGDGPPTEVTALAVYNNQLIAGGRFAQAGDVSARNIARWNGTSWSALGTGVQDAEFIDTVQDFAVYQGELIVAGAFGTAGGVSAANIARWNGNTWQPLDAGLSDGSMTLSIFQDELIAGGMFLQAGDVVVKSVTRWDGAEWLDMPGLLAPSRYYGIHTITPWAGSVVLGGGFATSSTNDPEYAFGLAAWDGQSLRSLGDPSSFVFASAVAPAAAGSSDLIVGGQFNSIGGVPAKRIARLNDTFAGGWQAMGEGLEGQVHAIAHFNGSTYAAGEIAASGGLSLNNIARWNGTSWQPVGSGPVTGVDGTVFCMKEGLNASPTQLDLVVGGAFTSAGGVPANGIAIYRESTIVPQFSWHAMGQGFNGPVLAVERFNGSVYAAGNFTASGATPVNYIARWNGTAWEAVGTGTNGIVRAMTVSNGTLVIGGTFTEAGGQPAERLARWDGQTWSSVAGGVDNGVTALGTFQNELHVGGTFMHVRFDALESPIWARYSEDGIPWFSEQPEPQAVDCGGDAQFSIYPALGYGGLEYQWRRNGTPIGNGPTGTGSTIATNGVTLHILDVSPADAGTYDCVLSNGCGSTTSWGATLTVSNCDSCDINCDGMVNLADAAELVELLLDSDLPGCRSMAGDANGDASVDGLDIQSFVDCLLQ